MQVTLFAYSDLLLFTKEDEPGRCSVLRNPLYLQSVKLQEGRQCPGYLSAAALGGKVPDLEAPLGAWLPASGSFECALLSGSDPGLVGSLFHSRPASLLIDLELLWEGSILEVFLGGYRMARVELRPQTDVS